jgi:Icc-related predicted phosphoesterase
MKLVCISDIHNKHKTITMPDGDVAICTGDISSRGYWHELKSFVKWFGALPHKKKILVCGNHDIGAEVEFKEEFVELCEENGVILLNDSGVEIDGVKFWGSPVTPRFGYGWAWNRDVEDNRTKSEIANYMPNNPIQKHWDLIPNDTNVLLTHGPPRGILDLCFYGGDRAGCPRLLDKVLEIKPKVHVFGHIHEQYGLDTFEGTAFVNASICTLQYTPNNKPIVVEI